ncbi:hypothetical protein Slin15195_G053240 [Septoria linicola]|uniref:Uncharacterized protein n=1 Tax=Septoria linicola TaxID=215465 RepID=A0A9Q9EIG3_9PEZI|nr:hypothetical protein Slin14017_G124030 [Septoria linicola]USW52005.1 hypothetical protein Slin15195_G053240 [Septoria linicola]
MATSETDPSMADPGGACFFFDRLPRELRDEIYELAYVKDGDCTLVLQNGYSVASHGNYSTENMESGMARFLVSKQWRTEALAQYFSASTLHVRSPNDLQYLFQQIGRTLSTNLRSLRLDHDYLPPRDVSKHFHDYTPTRATLQEQEDTLKWEFTPVAPLLNSCTHLNNLVIDTDWHLHWHLKLYRGLRDPLKTQWQLFVKGQFQKSFRDLKALRGLQQVCFRQDFADISGLHPQLQKAVQDLSKRMSSLAEEIKKEATKPKSSGPG